MVKKLKLKQLTIKPKNRKISTYFSISSNFFFIYKCMDQPGTLYKKKFSAQI